MLGPAEGFLLEIPPGALLNGTMQRAGIITIERRRRWSLPEKQEIVAQTLKPRASVSTVTQRYGLHPSQLFA